MIIIIVNVIIVIVAIGIVFVNREETLSECEIACKRVSNYLFSKLTLDRPTRRHRYSARTKKRRGKRKSGTQLMTKRKETKTTSIAYKNCRKMPGGE